LARLEPSVETNESIARHELAVDRVGKLPFGTGNHSTLSLAAFAHRKHIARIIRRSHRIFGAADLAGDQMAKRNLGHRLGGHQVAAQQPSDRLAMILCDGREKVQRARSGIWPRRVPLPPEAHDCETLAQQPRIARIVGDIPIAAIHQRQDAALAAVRHFKNHRAVSLARISGPDGHEIGGELDCTVSQIDRILQVNDPRVVRIVDRNREIHAAEDALVGAARSEALAAEYVLARRDFYPQNTRIRGRQAHAQYTGCSEQNGSSHDAKHSMQHGSRFSIAERGAEQRIREIPALISDRQKASKMKIASDFRFLFTYHTSLMLSRP